jgi:hypothetical protein
LWILFFFGWRPYRIDNVRENLFQVRNELFLLAANGDVSFDEPAYRVLRDRLNAVIRFAHTITLTRSVLFGLQAKSLPNQREAWLLTVQKLPQEQQRKLIDLDERTTFVILWQLFTGSPILWAALLVYVPISLIQSVKSARLKAAKTLRVDLIEEQAVIAFKGERYAEAERCLVNA